MFPSRELQVGSIVPFAIEGCRKIGLVNALDMLQEMVSWSRRDGSVVKSPCCSSRRPSTHSKRLKLHLHGIQ